MTAQDMLTALRRRPFAPFRLVSSDGTTCEVGHPEMVIVTPGSAVVGYPDPRGEGLAVRYDIVSLLHVVRLEPEPATPSQADAGPN